MVRRNRSSLKSVAMAIRFTRVSVVILLAVATVGLGPVRGQAQSPGTARPQFEVSSVKPNASQSDASEISSSAQDRFKATNVPLRFLILYAYDLLAHQLVDSPDWMSERSFDVVGLYPGERRPSDREIRLMLQNLLADRFGLKLRREQRELSAYDLVLARKDGALGPQIRKSEVDCAAWSAEKRAQTHSGGSSPVSPSGKRPVCAMIATRRYLTGGARTIQELAASLQSMLGRPVVDRTDLTGAYDIDLQWTPTDLRAGEAPNATSNDDPSLFTALQSQLGLKLIPQKERFDVFVVDHIELPDAN